MSTDITLKSVERREFSGKRKVLVVAADQAGLDHEMSAFADAWNDGWETGQTVAVDIVARDYNGKRYLNLYEPRQSVSSKPPIPVRTVPVPAASSNRHERMVEALYRHFFPEGIELS